MAGRLTASILEYCDKARIDRPRQHNGHNPSIHYVRPPTQAVMAKHRAQNQLHIQHENRKHVSVKRLGRRSSISICGTSSTHLRPVNIAISTATQKNVCARAACADEIAGGK